jgi:uncharacterized Zn finger protein
MTQYGSTECPKCHAVTSNLIQRAGASQYCNCRVCNSIFRAEVDLDGHFTGRNVPMILSSDRPIASLIVASQSQQRELK